MDEQKWHLLIGKIDNIDDKVGDMGSRLSERLEDIEARVGVIEKFKIKLTSIAGVVTLILGLSLDILKTKFFK